MLLLHHSIMGQPIFMDLWTWIKLDMLLDTEWVDPGFLSFVTHLVPERLALASCLLAAAHNHGKDHQAVHAI